MKEKLSGYKIGILKNVLLIIMPAIIVFSLIFAMLFLINNIKMSNDVNALNNNISTCDECIENLNDVEEVDISAPNLISYNFSFAKDLFEKRGDFVILVSSREYNDDLEKDLIVSQNPSEGECIKKGSIVSVVLSLGKKTKILPSIEGLSLSDAAVKIASEGFIPEKVDQYDDNVEYGFVIGYKDYVEGETLDAGSKVSIIVSKGKELKSS